MSIEDKSTAGLAAAKRFILGLVSDESVLQQDVADVVTEVDGNPVLKLGADEALAVVKAELAKVPALAADVALVEHVATGILAALTPVVAKVPVVAAPTA